jgi:anaerobic magnesium-protoporphyrin IX monomethyl ester cyclase
LLEVRPDDFDCTVITTYPGTPYYDEAVRNSPGVWTYTYAKTGDRLHAYELDYNTVADYYKGAPDGGYAAYVYTDFISSEELVAARDLLEKTVREKLGIPFNQSATAMNY